MSELNLGGFRQAADTLTGISGRKYSRQGVWQLWKRRDLNGFPDLKPVHINGVTRTLFDMEDIADWYAFAECATQLTILSGKRYTPSQVFRLWENRNTTMFPYREEINGRLRFDPADVKRWYKSAANAR